MRAIIALAVCAILGITVTSAVLGYKAGREGTVAETGTRVEAETDTDAGSPGYWG